MADELTELRLKVDRIADTEMASVKGKLDVLSLSVARIETMLASEAQRCPYREQIARSTNNIADIAKLEARLETMETAIHRLDLNVMKIAAIVIASSTVGAGLSQLLKLAL